MPFSTKTYKSYHPEVAALLQQEFSEAHPEIAQAVKEAVDSRDAAAQKKADALLMRFISEHPDAQAVLPHLYLDSAPNFNKPYFEQAHKEDVRLEVFVRHGDDVLALTKHYMPARPNIATMILDLLFYDVYHTRLAKEDNKERVAKAGAMFNALTEMMRTYRDTNHHAVVNAADIANNNAVVMIGWPQVAEQFQLANDIAASWVDSDPKSALELLSARTHQQLRGHYKRDNPAQRKKILQETVDIMTKIAEKSCKQDTAFTAEVVQAILLQDNEGCYGTARALRYEAGGEGA